MACAHLGVQSRSFATHVGAGGGDGADRINKREGDRVDHAPYRNSMPSKPCILRSAGRHDQGEASRWEGLDQRVRHLGDVDHLLCLLQTADRQTDRFSVVPCLQCEHGIKALSRGSGAQARERAGGIHHGLICEKPSDHDVEVHAVQPV